MRFRLRSEEIADAVRCNCSICTRKGAVMSARYYEPHEFELLSGEDALSPYQFGDRMVNHWFCCTCRIFPFADGPQTPGRYRVNLGCVAPTANPF